VATLGLQSVVYRRAAAAAALLTGRVTVVELIPDITVHGLAIKTSLHAIQRPRPDDWYVPSDRSMTADRGTKVCVCVRV